MMISRCYMPLRVASNIVSKRGMSSISRSGTSSVPIMGARVVTIIQEAVFDFNVIINDATTAVENAANGAVSPILPRAASRDVEVEELAVFEDNDEDGILREEGRSIQWMNRNARMPKKANHGARPCSHVRRKRKLRRNLKEHPDIPLPRGRKQGIDM